jgi:hypothetical protein
MGMSRRPFCASVHRFRDFVAVSVGTGEPVYMDVMEAREFAREIYVAARDCGQHAFADSEYAGKGFVFGDR